jgi:enoyl-CoA hydratase
LQACFTLHQLNHSHWAEIHESKYPVAEEQDGIPSWRVAPPVLLSVKDQVEGPVAGG